MNVYDHKPTRFLERVAVAHLPTGTDLACCAGFEFGAWRCVGFADHLIEWLPEYALPEEQLQIHHGNMYVKLKQAAVRVYTSDKYKARGEVGEIALHAICREFFNTIPISPRVFYKSATNDVIKSFDMVHVRFPTSNSLELWLGESKFYLNATAAIADAIASVNEHLDRGFLTNQKMLLGPQIPKTVPRYDEVVRIFESQTSLDKLISSAVFVVGVVCNSKSLKSHSVINAVYEKQIADEFAELQKKLNASGLKSRIRLALVYLPLLDKTALAKSFDTKLKGLQ